MIITAVGIGTTILGSLELTKGHVLKGIGAVFLGMTSTNLGGRFAGLDPKSHSKLMQCTLGAGTGAVGVQGALRLAKGVKQKNAAEIIKGGIQTAAGIAGTALVYSLDSRIIVIAHQASVIALSSSFIAKLGFDDLAKGRYGRGLCKILLGIGGIASAGYYVYSSCLHKETLSADQIAFLETHKAEIEELYESKRASGNWTKLGSGISKTVFEHPDLPEMVIKIPRYHQGSRGTTGEDDLRIDHTNLERIRSIAAQYDRIVLPESHLYLTSKGLVIVEQKFILADYSSVPEDPDKQKTMDQFHAFVKSAGLCDLFPNKTLNAGIISQTIPPRIGIIDFDCTKKQFWDWNFRNPGSQFFVVENRNQIGALVLAAGTAVLGGAAAIAKKISKINPRTVLQIGFGIGAITAAYVASQDNLFQPTATMVGTGLVMAATAVVTIAVAKVSLS